MRPSSTPAHRIGPCRIATAGAALGIAALSAPAPAVAQEAAGGRTVAITPTFSATQTYTDSRRTSGFSGGEFITQLSPGLRLSSRSGRIQGSLSYSLNAAYYSEHPETRSLQNSLSAAFSAEAVEKWAYVDARASVTQQALSAFGQQTVANTAQANANRTEVATVSVSPYVRGSLAGLANYEVRLNAGATNARDSIASDSTNASASVTLSSARPGAVFGWALIGSRQRVDFRAGRATDTDRVNAALTATPAHDLQLSLNGGKESTNVGGFRRQNYDNWGWGARWTPTERTNVALQSDHRYFGNSHSLVFEHRMPRSVWRFSDSRNATSGSDPNGVGQPITLYQLLFDVYASKYPDPVLREQFVLEALRFFGLNPNAIISGGLLTSAVTLQRRQDLSFALLGLRDTLNLQAFTSESRLLDNPNNTPDDGPVRLLGGTGTLSHRLTPTASISLTGSRQKTLGTRTRRGNDLKSLALSWSGQLSRHASTSLGARYTVFNSDIDAYRETSVTASISLQF